MFSLVHHCGHMEYNIPFDRFLTLKSTGYYRKTRSYSNSFNFYEQLAQFFFLLNPDVCVFSNEESSFHTPYFG